MVNFFKKIIGSGEGNPPKEKKPKKIWFKAKEYGYGWYPATWEGWTVLAIYIVFIIGSFFVINQDSHSVSDTLYGFLPRLAMATFILISVCVSHGEKAKWRWGEEKSKDEREKSKNETSK